MTIERSTKFEQGHGIWVILAALVGLNLWFDYYHPIGLLADVVIAAVLIGKWPRPPGESLRPRKRIVVKTESSTH
jgi:hypothetical protein